MAVRKKKCQTVSGEKQRENDKLKFLLKEDSFCAILPYNHHKQTHTKKYSERNINFKKDQSDLSSFWASV